jgi:hypothetical protein
MKFSSAPAWLRAGLNGKHFKIPHSTCTKRSNGFIFGFQALKLKIFLL